MSAPTAYAMAARIWAELPGTHAQKSKALLELIAALRDTQRAQRPPTTTRGTPDVTAAIASAIGKTLSQVETLHVPLEGVQVNLATIFRAAQEPNHPWAAASAAFLSQHALELRVTRTGARPTVRVARREVPGAAELAFVKAYIADRANRTATDHSGGITSSVPVERGDD